MFVDNNTYKYESLNYNNKFNEILRNNQKISNKYQDRQDKMIHQLERMKNEQKSFKLIDNNFYEKLK